MTLVPLIDELDGTWLSRFLDLEGATDVAVTSIDQGQVANCYRPRVRHGASVSSVIAKVPSNDEASRVQHVVRATRDDEIGLGVLEQLVIGPYEPAGLRGLLDGT